MFNLIVAYSFLIKNMKTRGVNLSAKQLTENKEYRDNAVKEAKKVQNNQEINWAVNAIEKVYGPI